MHDFSGSISLPRYHRVDCMRKMSAASPDASIVWSARKYTCGA